MENFELLVEQINELTSKGEISALRDCLTEINVVDTALIIEELELKEKLFVFRVLPKDISAEVFAYLEPETQTDLVKKINDTELEILLDEMFLDDTVDFLEEMPANVVKKILKNAKPETRKDINHLLRYPEDSAGSIMTVEYVDLKENMTVEDALKRIRRTGPDKETINICYVTDTRRHLLGFVSIRTLLLAEEEDLIGEIMERNFIAVQTLDDQESTAQALSKYDFLALPVVDGEGRMVGIVTFDDAMDVMVEEATEDMELMGAMTPSEKPYLKSGPVDLFKNRIPWLMLLMLSATFTGLIITSFEDALAQVVVLTAFIPMLMGTGGNSGSQSSVTVIRSLSLGELKLGDIFEVLWKELRTSILCGVALAVVCFAKIWLVDHLLFGNQDITLMVDLVVCLALAVTVIVAKIVGCLLPIGAKALKLDPAVMASPFISTIVDALSLLVYFLFAKMLLGV